MPEWRPLSLREPQWAFSTRTLWCLDSESVTPDILSREHDALGVHHIIEELPQAFQKRNRHQTSNHAFAASVAYSITHCPPILALYEWY
jgi:hypothetical protein